MKAKSNPQNWLVSGDYWFPVPDVLQPPRKNRWEYNLDKNINPRELPPTLKNALFSFPIRMRATKPHLRSGQHPVSPVSTDSKAHLFHFAYSVIQLTANVPAFFQQQTHKYHVLLLLLSILLQLLVHGPHTWKWGMTTDSNSNRS